MITTPVDIIEQGFDENLLGITDPARLESFLNSTIVVAKYRLQVWLNVKDEYALVEAAQPTDEKRMRFARAELFLSIAELLPFAHAASSVGETSINVMGFSIKMADVTPEESIQIRRSLADEAYRILGDSVEGSKYSGVAIL